MKKSQRLAAGVICVIVLTILRVFFTILFFIASVICIVHAESRVERCDGHLTLSQKEVDSLNTTSTFVETFVSSFLIFLIFRWKPFNYKNFLTALPRQGNFWMWTALWIARIFTNVLIGIIPGLQQNYPVLIILGFSLPLEFAATTIFASALAFVGFRDVKTWLRQHFPTTTARWLTYLYRALLFTYGLRMLALFLYDSFLVARHITRESQYRELDSILLALDVFYRGSLCVFFFRKFFEFPIPDVLQESLDNKRPKETDEQLSKCKESFRSKVPEKQEDLEVDEKRFHCAFNGSDVLSEKDLDLGHMERENSATTVK
ncbi:uncharacterized protein LOC111335201 [Stylophora pistillata]|uniref:uncharacterized protein LOC111335201 n=1 Tax=Stylophora pistillata TaxID=50429 RepID=UPI000C03B5F5|nr:uncharacterized protein LOC111335201 [Stylophora pistillata]